MRSGAAARIVVGAALFPLLLTLTGCTAAAAPTPTTASAPAEKASVLLPLTTELPSVAAAQTEAERLVAQLVSTIPGTQVRNNDSHSQEVVKTIAPGGHY